jgi:hypothetical protein
MASTPHGSMTMGNFIAPAEPLSATYTIEARLDPERKCITGSETIRLVNRSRLTLDTLALAKGADGCSFDVSVGGSAPSRHEGATDTPVLVALPAPLVPGAAAELHVTFETPIALAERYDDWRPVDWHPKLWWGYPTQDDYEVRLDAPAEWGLAASGRRGDDGVWRSSGVRSFGLVTSPEYQAMEAEAGETLVRCLYREAGKECAEGLLRTAVETIAYYRAEYGFYPYPFLSIVPGVKSRSLGGYPVATGIVAIHQMEKLIVEHHDDGHGIMVHEIGHEYWGECVMDTDAPDWLWIGLGIYLDRWYWAAHGVPEGGIGRIVARQYLQGVKDGLDTTIERPVAQVARLKFDHNNVVRHGKGSLVIRALASVLGQETFRDLYRKCLQNYRGKRLGAREFQRFCEAETGQDLGWFFDQWVRSNRVLDYRIASTESSERDGRHVTRVTIERVGTLDMPIPVEARFADGATQRARTERLLRAQQLAFESDAPLAEAVLDPEKVLSLLSEAVGSE